MIEKKTISKSKLLREINALGDAIQTRIDIFEREKCNFQDEYNKGVYFGAIQGMKDMRDNLAKLCERLELQ